MRRGAGPAVPREPTSGTDLPRSTPTDGTARAATCRLGRAAHGLARVARPVGAAARAPGRLARRLAGTRRGRVVAPSLAAGVLLALSLPPWGWWPLAFGGAGLLWWRLDGLRARARLLAGWVAGLGLFGLGLSWATSFNVYGGIVLVLAEALAPAIASWATPPRRGRSLALPGAMVLVEALRSIWPFGGLPLGGVALGQAAGPLAPAARLGGPLLVTGLVWLGGAAAAQVVLAAWRTVHGARQARRARVGWDQLAAHAARIGQGAPPGPPAATGPGAPTWPATATGQAGPRPGPRIAPLAAGALVGIAAVAGVCAVGAAAPDGGPAAAVVRVAAVQGGGVRGLRKAQVDPATVFQAQLDATAQIPAADGGRPPALVVWPEDVVALDQPLRDSPAVEAELGALATSLHATLVVGVTATLTPTTFRNEVVAFGPDGSIVGRFEKVHRVPFGEYVPYRGFFEHLANLSAVPQDAVPGHGDGVLHTPAGPLGTMVSYEVFFADRGRVATRAGAELLVVPTNTSSYSTSQVPAQEVAADRLQAIAEGRDLVQAAPTGFSDVVDHRGRLLARTALGNRAVLVRDVALRTGRTWYTRLGDGPVLVVAALLVVAGVLADATRGTSTAGAEAHRRFRQRRQVALAEAEARARALRRPANAPPPP